MVRHAWGPLAMTICNGSWREVLTARTGGALMGIPLCPDFGTREQSSKENPIKVYSVKFEVSQFIMLSYFFPLSKAKEIHSLPPKIIWAKVNLQILFSSLMFSLWLHSIPPPCTQIPCRVDNWTIPIHYKVSINIGSGLWEWSCYGLGFVRSPFFLCICLAFRISRGPSTVLALVLWFKWYGITLWLGAGVGFSPLSWFFILKWAC